MLLLALASTYATYEFYRMLKYDHITLQINRNHSEKWRKALQTSKTDNELIYNLRQIPRIIHPPAPPLTKLARFIFQDEYDLKYQCRSCRSEWYSGDVVSCPACQSNKVKKL
jgi:rubrerythrin